MQRNFIMRLGLSGGLLALLAGCIQDPDQTSTRHNTGKAIFDRQCMQCHGADGIGAGPASLGLGVAPPGLQGLARNNAGVFPREYVTNVINGTLTQNDPDAAMPDFGTRDFSHGAKANVAGGSPLRPSDLVAILRYLESIQM